MTQVNEINMARWIVALRSGKYTQTRGALRDYSGGMCCLGVACEISGAGEWVSLRNTEARGYQVGLETRDAAMPTVVASALGVPSNPMLSETISCISANDDREWSFAQIADALESRFIPGKKAEEILGAASV